jgi:hypothetical protein
MCIEEHPVNTRYRGHVAAQGNDERAAIIHQFCKRSFDLLMADPQQAPTPRCPLCRERLINGAAAAHNEAVVADREQLIRAALGRANQAIQFAPLWMRNDHDIVALAMGMRG